MHTMKIKKIVDLTHTLNEHNPTWDGLQSFEMHTILDYHQCAGKTKFKLQAISFKKTGTGTHIDSPAHCFEGKATAGQIPLAQLCVPAYVIDISAKATADYLLSVDDILQFEKIHGAIQKNSLVIVYSGWSKHWHDAKKYRNENAQGIMQFPSISAEAAQLLIERDAAGIGIDTLSTDCPGSGDPVHYIMLSNEKYQIENLANCDQLPPVGAFVVALPLKVQSTESPTRVIAFIME